MMKQGQKIGIEIMGNSRVVFFPHVEVIVSVVSWREGWPVQFSVPLCEVVIWMFVLY
jgi:hypothetical protein